MNYQQLCEEVIVLSKKVGQFLKEENKKIRASDVESKEHGNSLVTYVDKAAEKLIIEKLSQLIPESGFIAEEGTSDKIGKTYNWIIDPLDGTTNFIHGLPIYAVSIALQEGEEIVLGVVYEVNLEECFYAWKESKAYLNGKEIHVSTAAKMEDSLIATGFPYWDFGKMDAYLEILKDFTARTRGIRRLGSAATDLAYVAAGRFEAFYEYSLKPWDVAAGAFIVERAGGKVTDFSGNRDLISGKEMLASNGVIHDILQEKIADKFL
ncbi:MAG: inositol monophosphatase family protein [Bacteroidetes bacterium]|nr:inositol monophosphatase family protein [Bacteroidota bacterium]